MRQRRNATEANATKCETRQNTTKCEIDENANREQNANRDKMRNVTKTRNATKCEMRQNATKCETRQNAKHDEMKRDETQIRRNATQRVVTDARLQECGYSICETWRNASLYTDEDDEEAMQGEGERNTDDAFRMESLDDLYHIGPQEDNQMGLQDIALGLDIETQPTSSACLSDEAKSLSFGEFNFWSAGMEEFNTLFTVLQDSFDPSFVNTGLDPNFPQPQHGTFYHASPDFALDNFAAVQNPEYPVENFFLNSSYLHSVHSDEALGLSVATPHNSLSSLTTNISVPDILSPVPVIPSPVLVIPSPVLDIPSPVTTTSPMPPANAQSKSTKAVVSGGRSHCLVGNKANGQTNGNDMVRPTIGLTAELQPDKAPHCTARQHIPSNHTQVLNAIGLLNARVCVTFGEAKENDGPPVTPATKREAKPTNQPNK
ncbi:hypothetical protein DFJ58DRAFT_839598 [Suillus subalutaceus]|uniref:uncharacterized protein n=1 Tax=Suillus subalutaceus TaxID=48586 RepID=UPI001B86C292|nr:uncharacterized protein DFJ58DRAFT_839598 [Suillus subalutaceus]KAG1861766.1 hypothetical protein DFJ58DRAFT_839598 [Suillus subalutaceus]